ncbi:hypothetical protein BCR42DRAFT_419127 [Absidia repens]|uniref:Protein transport protein SEC31 n=1 Tax=Absidia repens TaxID=90262 RepID=A0A1X2IAX5_9FUNG|nr:hypothetical protein BCR42DRAFT_419127 [Absidia repens]
MVKTAYDLPDTTFTWCPTTPILATSSYHDKFSQLELFQLGTDRTGTIQNSIGKINSNSSGEALGVIAAGTDSGGLELWDPHVIVDPDNSGTRNALISQQTTTYTQSIFYMDFNLHQPNLLVTAGRDNEVFVWDLANYPEIPYTPGPHTTAMDVQLTKVAWNCQVPYILSTCFSNGQTIILDLRSKKKVMELTGKNHLSSVVWHPDVATQLVTASIDDAHPVVTLWDLRHAHTPMKTMKAHSKGVLDLSWCRQDSELLVSSGKDGKILTWNPGTTLHSEIAKTESPAQIDFCPRNPNWLASASLAGEINVWSIQQGHRSTSSDVYESNLPSDELQSSIKQPPKWLRRPVGSTFGFGGKLVLFFQQRPDSRDKQAENVYNQPTAKLITIKDSDIVRRASALQYAKIDQQMLLKFVDQKCQQPDADEHWLTLKILFAQNAREQLVNYLGLNKQELLLQKGLATHSPSASSSPLFPTATATGTTTDTTTVERTTTLSGIFRSADNKGVSPDSDFFSSTNVSSKSNEIVTTNKWLRDMKITQAIATGDFDAAVSLCMEDESRMADALLLAISGGPDLFARTRQLYLERQTEISYMKLLDHLVRQDLMSFVQNSHVDDWKLVLTALCTFAASDEFGALCETLGRRLETAAASLPVQGGSHMVLADTEQLMGRAAICYIVAGKLECLLPIWLSECGQNGGPNDTYADRLQDFMEKVTVFFSAIDFEDPMMVDDDKHDAGVSSLVTSTKNHRSMDLLYGKYCEYADLLAASGQFDTAIKYLGLVPESYYGQDSNWTMAVIRDRIYGATTQHGMVLLRKNPTFPFDTNQAILDPANRQHQTNTINLQQPHRLFHQPSLKMLQPRQEFFELNRLDENSTRDSISDSPFMTARDIPDFENMDPNRTRLHQEKYFFDSFTSKTESPTTLDTASEKQETAEGTNSVYLDMQSLVITSPVTLPSSDTGGINYFEKEMQQDPYQQQQYMDTPATPDSPPKPTAIQQHGGPNRRQQQKQQQQDKEIKNMSLYPLQQQHSLQYPSNQQNQEKIESPQEQQQQQNVKPHQPRIGESKTASPPSMQAPLIETRNNYANNTRGEKSSAYQHRTSPRNPLHKLPQGQAQDKRRYSKETFSNIKTEHEPIYQALSKVTPQPRNQMESGQKKYWEDTDKRLDNLFQQLNNHDVSDSVAQSLITLVQAFSDGQYEKALNIQMHLVTTKYEECSSWLLAVKRIIEYKMQKL